MPVGECTHAGRPIAYIVVALPPRGGKIARATMKSVTPPPAPTAPRNPPTVPTRVWDLPTRACHWLLAACVFAAIACAEVGGNWMPWHFRCGYAAMSLLMFRWIWGFAGGRWSRFASFAPSPRRVVAYLRGAPDPRDAAGAGHNPLGALSVWALLLLLTAQVATGLFADDEIASSGPLNKFVGARAAGRLTGWHADIGGTALMALIGLHLLAIAFYARRRGRNLLHPMLTGDAPLPPAVPASRDSAGTRLLALAIWGACLAAVLALLRWAG